MGKYLLRNVIYPRRYTSQATIIHAGYTNGKLSPCRFAGCNNVHYSNLKKVSDRSFSSLTRCALDGYAEFFLSDVPFCNKKIIKDVWKGEEEEEVEEETRFNGTRDVLNRDICLIKI